MLDLLKTLAKGAVLGLAIRVVLDGYAMLKRRDHSDTAHSPSGSEKRCG